MLESFRHAKWWRALRAAPCTALLLAAIWLMFAVELLMHAPGNDAMLLRLGGLPEGGIARHEYWRLLSYALLHSGWWHIALNTVLLVLCGPVVERALGKWWTLLIVLAGAAGAGAAMLLAHHGGDTSIGVGASGFCFALLGAALIATRRDPASSTHRRLRTILFVGIAISFLPGVSLAAHIAGLAIGSFTALFGHSTAVLSRA